MIPGIVGVDAFCVAGRGSAKSLWVVTGTFPLARALTGAGKMVYVGAGLQASRV